ncbi:MAG: nuclear transport factor 2 family protein [Burkholderiales bacterium]
MKPKEIFSRLHEFVIKYDAEGQADLFSEDAVWEFPFAPEGIPKIIEGREKIIAAAKAGMERSKKKGRRITDYKSVEIYETNNPEVIIAEFTLQGEITSTGKTYEIPYIQLLKTHNDKILLLRDYFPGEILKMAFSN